MISAIVCGCSSMMYVSRFWLSTFRRKPNGIASIDWRMLSSAAAALGAERFLNSDLASSRPPPRPPIAGLASANSLMTRSCSSAAIVRVRAISIDTCSTCLGSSFDISSPASSSGSVISSTAAL